MRAPSATMAAATRALIDHNRICFSRLPIQIPRAIAVRARPRLATDVPRPPCLPAGAAQRRLYLKKSLAAGVCGADALRAFPGLDRGRPIKVGRCEIIREHLRAG